MDTVKKYIKNIDNINVNNIMSPCLLSQMVTYLFVIGALESWKVQKYEV